MNQPKNIVEPLKESMSRALQAPAKFDAEIYHVMDKRDEALISDEILHGSVSGVFVYSFPMTSGEGSKNVSGISVRGASHLARHYGGLKHRIVASSDKRGKLFTFKSYPSDGIPMSVHCNIVPELAEEPDTYEVVVELADIKTGLSIQVSRLEKRFENKKNNGGIYERPNYTVIAESKAYRNAVLRLVPQEVQEEFKKICIAQGKSIDIKASAIDEKRDNVIKFAASKAIPLTREEVYDLDWSQISGLSEAAKDGLEAFYTSAETLGLLAVSPQQEKTPALQPAKPTASEPKQVEIKKEVEKENKSAAQATEPEMNFG